MRQGVIQIAFYTAGLFVSAVPAIAGQVYGTVTGANGPVRNGSVHIECHPSSGQGSTDQYGSYSVYVDGAGKCKITVNESEPLSVRVYDDEVRYDLRVEGNSLQRK